MTISIGGIGRNLATLTLGGAIALLSGYQVKRALQTPQSDELRSLGGDASSPLVEKVADGSLPFLMGSAGMLSLLLYRRLRDHPLLENLDAEHTFTLREKASGAALFSLLANPLFMHSYDSLSAAALTATLGISAHALGRMRARSDMILEQSDDIAGDAFDALFKGDDTAAIDLSRAYLEARGRDSHDPNYAFELSMMLQSREALLQLGPLEENYFSSAREVLTAWESLSAEIRTDLSSSITRPESRALKQVRKNAYREKGFQSLTHLLILGSLYNSGAVKKDLEYAIKHDPANHRAYHLLRAELEQDPTQRQILWAEMYRNSIYYSDVELRADTSNNAGDFGGVKGLRQYYVKAMPVEAARIEARQIEETTEEVAGVQLDDRERLDALYTGVCEDLGIDVRDGPPQVDCLSVAAILSPEETQDELGALFTRVHEGGRMNLDLMNEAVAQGDREGLLRLYTNMIYSDALTADGSIDQSVENEINRLEKARADLERNTGLREDIGHGDYDWIMEHYEHLFLYDTDFARVYDRDGKPDNSIVLPNGNTVLIDLNAVKSAPHLYSLVKAIEVFPHFELNDEGFAVRNRLVQFSHDIIDATGTCSIPSPEIQQMGYYTAILEKAVSQDDLGRRRGYPLQQRKNPYQAAAWGIRKIVTGGYALPKPNGIDLPVILNKFADISERAGNRLT